MASIDLAGARNVHGDDHKLVLHRPDADRSSSTARINLSFEFLSPTTPAMEESLWQAIKRLEPLDPTDVTIAYGLDNATRMRARAVLARIRNETDLNVAEHITLHAARRHDIDQVIRDYWEAGVRRITIGCGPPASTTRQQKYAIADLVRRIATSAPFDITVPVYPRKHLQSLRYEADINILKRRIDAGATSAVTQWIFDNDIYLRFLDRAHSAGITIPILPTLLPLYDLHHIRRLAARNCVSIPPRLLRRIQCLEDDCKTRRFAAAALSAAQILNLVSKGVSHIHFCTLNDADLIYGVCRIIGRRGTSIQS